MTQRAQRLRARKAVNKHQIADYAAVLAYDGQAFAGYARQPNMVTVEGSLRHVLSKYITGFRRLAVAGRTDRGVSAVAQVVSFRGDYPQPLEEISHHLNAVQSDALWCRSLQYAPYGFHAQFGATRRRYCYLHPATQEEWARSSLINTQLTNLEGRRCMFAFSRGTRPGASTIRRIYRSRCYPAHINDIPVLNFEVEAQGFLRKMMRVLVSTALKHGRHTEPPDILCTIAAQRDRRLTEHPAPPEHLRFAAVHFDQWSPLVGW